MASMRVMIIVLSVFALLLAFLLAKDVVVLGASRSAECGLGDVIRSRQEGFNPTDPDVAASLHVVTVDDGLMLVDSLMGRFWIRAADFSTLGVMISEERSGHYDVGGYGVRSGDVVLDCGANIGVYTRHALMHGAKQVIAIEPAPESLACLRRNFPDEIAAGRVVVYPKGVWDREDTLTLSACDHAWCDSFTAEGRPPSERTVRAPLTTIDRLVLELKLNRVDFIKMDIEGAEQRALHGAIRTVTAHHPRMAIALEHKINDAQRIPALIRQLWPGVHTFCGPCSLQAPDGKLRVQPQVVMAY